MPGGDVEEGAAPGRTRHILDGALERGDGLRHDRRGAGTRARCFDRQGRGWRVIDLAGDPDGLLAPASPRRTRPARRGTRRAAPRETDPTAEAEPRDRRSPWSLPDPAQALGGLPILPSICQTKPRGVRRCLERDVVGADGEARARWFISSARSGSPGPGAGRERGQRPAPAGARRRALRRGPRPHGHGRCSPPARPRHRAPLASRWRSMACSVRARLSGRCRSAASACSKPAAASR